MQAMSGLVADGRQLVSRGRAEATSYREFYGTDISGKVLNERLSNFVQLYSLYGSVRPFGTSVILGCVDKNGPQLYMIEPSGISWVRVDVSSFITHLYADVGSPSSSSSSL